MAIEKNEHWVKFVTLYKHLPELWNPKIEKYKNKNVRAAAYAKLTSEYKNIDENATIEKVKSRIRNMRIAYKRELKKKIYKEKNNAGMDNRYEPNLWYFHDFNFLKECILPEDDMRSMHSSDEERILPPTAKIEQGNINPGCYERKEPLKKDTMHMENLNKNKKSNEAERKKMSANYERNKLLEKAAMHMEKLSKHRERDEADIFAECWATSYRKLDDTQKLYAKRACDEIFILGQLGKLNFNTVRTETSSYKSSLANFHDVRNRQSTSTLIHSTLSQNNHEEGSQYSSFTDIPPKRNEYDDESSNCNSFEDSVGEESDELPNTSMELEDSKIKTERFEVIEHLSEQPPNTSMELENSEIKIEKFEEQCQVPDVMFSEGVDRQTEFINGNNEKEDSDEEYVPGKSTESEGEEEDVDRNIGTSTQKTNNMEWSSESENNGLAQQPKRYRPTDQPFPEKRLDGLSHWPEEIDLKSARMCRRKDCKSRTRTRCTKCDVFLCFNKKNNCFKMYHTSK